MRSTSIPRCGYTRCTSPAAPSEGRPVEAPDVFLDRQHRDEVADVQRSPAGLHISAGERPESSIARLIVPARRPVCMEEGQSFLLECTEDSRLVGHAHFRRPRGSANGAAGHLPPRASEGGVLHLRCVASSRSRSNRRAEVECGQDDPVVGEHRERDGRGTSPRTHPASAEPTSRRRSRSVAVGAVSGSTCPPTIAMNMPMIPKKQAVAGRRRARTGCRARTAAPRRAESPDRKVPAAIAKSVQRRGSSRQRRHSALTGGAARSRVVIRDPLDRPEGGADHVQEHPLTEDRLELRVGR